MRKLICLWEVSKEDVEWFEENVNDFKVTYNDNVVSMYNGKREYIGNALYTFTVENKEQETALILKFGSLNNFMSLRF